MQTDADLVNYYHISGYGLTYLLEDGVQQRTFVKQPLQAIFQQVLGAYPGDALPYQLKPQHTATLPYIVQYGESNFHFLSRLASQYGQWLYYDGQTLHLGRTTGGAPLLFQSTSSQRFTLGLHLQPSQTQGGHYNYRDHQSLKAKAAPPSPGHPFGQLALDKSQQLFSQPLRLRAASHDRNPSQLQQTFDGLAAQRAASQVNLHGQSELFELTPGRTVAVQDAADQAYGTFWVLNVQHTVDGDGNYSNSFEALPDAVPAPPLNPLYPPLDAQPELAQVIDLQDPRNLGRIRVRFLWPVDKPTQAESAWLRVSTPYAGNGKGQLFTPEIGSQVLVGYEHGLAELPVVLGNLFHPHNPQQAKYTTPQNHLKGLQTAGGNKLVMSDKHGEQTMLLSNSGKKGTAVELSFKGDGRVIIKSQGSVQIISPNIALEAGEKGDISLHAKNITMVAEEKLKLQSSTSETTAETLSVYATQSMSFEATNTGSFTSGQTTVAGNTTTSVQAPVVNIN